MIKLLGFKIKKSPERYYNDEVHISISPEILDEIFKMYKEKALGANDFCILSDYVEKANTLKNIRKLYRDEISNGDKKIEKEV